MLLRCFYSVKKGTYRENVRFFLKNVTLDRSVWYSLKREQQLSLGCGISKEFTFYKSLYPFLFFTINMLNSGENATFETYYKSFGFSLSSGGVSWR